MQESENGEGRTNCPAMEVGTCAPLRKALGLGAMPGRNYSHGCRRRPVLVVRLLHSAAPLPLPLLSLQALWARCCATEHLQSCSAAPVRHTGGRADYCWLCREDPASSAGDRTLSEHQKIRSQRSLPCKAALEQHQGSGSPSPVQRSGQSANA